LSSDHIYLLITIGSNLGMILALSVSPSEKQMPFFTAEEHHSKQRYVFKTRGVHRQYNLIFFNVECTF
jgi:hypothetical protein